MLHAILDAPPAEADATLDVSRAPSEPPRA
jgi:hypothetical protein